MMPVSITYLNQVNMATAWLQVRGLATLRTLSFGHGIELGFFSWVQDHMNPDVPGYDRPPKRTVCFVEIVVFA